MILGDSYLGSVKVDKMYLNGKEVYSGKTEAEKVIDRMIAPSQKFQDAITVYIEAEQAAGNWELTDDILFFGADTENNAKTFWKRHTITEDFGPKTFIQDVGFEFDVIEEAKYFITDYTPNSGDNQWSSNNCLIEYGIGSLVKPNLNKFAFSVGDVTTGNSRTMGYTVFSGTTGFQRSFGVLNGKGIPNPTGDPITGDSIFLRVQDSSGTTLYIDNVEHSIDATAASTVTSGVLKIGINEALDVPFQFYGIMTHIIVGAGVGFDVAAHHVNITNLKNTMQPEPIVGWGNVLDFSLSPLGVCVFPTILGLNGQIIQTVSMWIKPRNNVTNLQILDNDGLSGLLMIDANTLEVNFEYDLFQFAVVEPFVVDVWYNIIVTKFEDRMTVYVNGVKSVNEVLNQSVKLAFKKIGSGNSLAIDDLMVTDSEKTNQIKASAVYNNGVYGDITTLYSSIDNLYKFDESSGLIVPDSAGSDDGNLVGFGTSDVWWQPH